MATRQGTAHEIAARCKRLPGWTVTAPRSMSGGYKITAPDGWVTQVHLTSSDMNAAKTILRELNNHGLSKDEEAWEEQRVKEREEELARQRKAANLKARQLASQVSITAKAAGPYAAPEPVEKEWFVTAHPAPWHKWVVMTPELASYLLDNHNTDNRPLNKATVEHYRNIILSGQWRLTHQGMAMDVRQILQDGQHRLSAIVAAGIDVPVSFYVGMPEENFKAIDEGLLRKAAHLFGKDGEGYAASLQATIKLIGAYNDPLDSRRAYHTKQTNASIYDAFQGDDKNALREAVRWGVANYRKPKMNATGLAAAHFLLRKQNGHDNPYVIAFLHGLITGFKGATRIALDEDDPRQKLRDYVENLRDSPRKRLNAFDNLCLVLIAWNQVVENHRPRFARFADNMDVPGILQCSPDGRWASAAPNALMGEVQWAMEQVEHHKAEQAEHVETAAA